jgi:hypothetical protein
MSRSGVFYAINAMERTAAGAAAADAPARRAVDREALTTAHPDGSIFSRIRHVLAIVHHRGAASRAGRGRRNLSGAARVD